MKLLKAVAVTTYINHNNKEQSYILVQTGKSLSTSLT